MCRDCFKTCNKWAKWQGLSVDINICPKGLSAPALWLYIHIKALKYIPGPGVRWAFTGPLVLWFLSCHHSVGLVMLFPALPWGLGTVVTNDWCMMVTCKGPRKCYHEITMPMSSRVISFFFLFLAQTLGWILAPMFPSLEQKNPQCTETSRFLISQRYVKIRSIIVSL